MKDERLKLYGYTRDNKKGEILNYHEKDISNVIHTFVGNGWTTDQIVAVIYD